MARTVKATLPTGEVVELAGVPETATEAQIREKVQAKLGVAPTELSTGWLDTAKVLGSAAGRGVASLGGMVQDVGRNLLTGIREGGEVLTGQRKVSEMQPLADKFKNTSEIAGMGTQPITAGQRYASSIVEGATGGLVGGVGGLAKSAAIGAAGGLGAELAGSATSQNPIARIAGALLGGAGAGALSSAKTTRADLARETLRDAKDADLDHAMATMRGQRKAFAERGVENAGLNLSQAMPESSNIDAMVEKLANSRYGTHTTAQLRAQPKQTSALVEGELMQLPGTQRPWQDLANRAQEAATKLIQGEKAEAGDRWARAYITDSVGRPKQVPAETVERVAADLLRKAEEAGFRTTKAMGLKQLAARLYDPQGNPITDGQTLNEILKDAAGKAKPVSIGSRGLDAAASKFLQRQIGETRDAFGEAFEPFKKANAAFKGYTESVVEPLKKSVVGDIAGRAGAQPDRQAVVGHLTKVFDQGTVPGSARSEILTLQKQLQRTDPEAYTDAAKTWLSGKITQAAAPVDNRFPEDFAKKLVQSFGSETATVTEKSKGLQDVLVGMARAKELPDDTFLGLPKLMQYIAASSRRPSGFAGASAADFDRIAGSTTANTLARGSVFNPFRPALVMMDNLLRGDAYQFVDRLITTPEGVEVLRTLAKSQPHSRKAQAALASFAATLATGTPKPKDGLGE